MGEGGGWTYAVGRKQEEPRELPLRGSRKNISIRIQHIYCTCIDDMKQEVHAKEITTYIFPKRFFTFK